MTPPRRAIVMSLAAVLMAALTACATGAPDERDNPGRVNQEVAGGRLVASLAIIPERPAQVQDSELEQVLEREGRFDPTTFPRTASWVLTNDRMSDVAFTFDESVTLERWTDDQRWVPVPGFPASGGTRLLEPDQMYNEGGVPLVYPPDPEAFERAHDDIEALADALEPLEVGWYRATKSIRPTKEGSPTGGTVELQAVFHVIEQAR